MSIHCSWAYKLVQLFRKIWQLLKLNIYLPYDPDILLLGIYPKRTHKPPQNLFHKCLQWPFFAKQLVIEIQLIYNVVLVSGVQQSDSVIYTYLLLQILFHYRLLQYSEYRSLLFIYYIYSSLYLLISNSYLILPTPFSLW